jgi:hypothetical protein
MITREGEEPMNRAIVCAIVIAVVFPASAMAGMLFFGWQLTGTIMDSPAEYSGALTWGAGGSFYFRLDDAGWPDPSTQAARWDYIFNTYFAGHYDNSTPGAYNWKGQVDAWYTLELNSAPPGFNGTVSGEFRPQITLRDIDEDGIFDPFEREGENLINGSFTINCNVGTGELATQRGTGSMQDNYMSFPYLPATDVMPNGSGSVNLSACPSALEESSWGNIKALYR